MLMQSCLPDTPNLSTPEKFYYCIQLQEEKGKKELLKLLMIDVIEGS